MKFDKLNVNQKDGSALLTGNVLIIQGEMRLSADSVLVVRKPDGKKGSNGSKHAEMYCWSVVRMRLKPERQTIP